MKKIITLSIFFLFPLLVFAEISISQWMSMLAKTDPIWREGYELYIQEMLDAQILSDSWLPLLNVTPSYSLTKNGVQNDLDLLQSASVDLALTQKLPFGGNISASLVQNLSKNTLFEYQVSGSISVTQPLWYSHFSIDRVLKKTLSVRDAKKKAGESRWETVQLRRTADTLSLFLNTAVLIERQKNMEELIAWHLKNLENNKILFESGQISNMDYVENRNLSSRVESEYIQAEKILISYLDEAKLWGFDVTGINIEQWLTSIEYDLITTQLQTAVERELDIKRYDLSTSLNLEIELSKSSAPNLFIKYSCTPATNASSKADAWSAVSSFWNNEVPFLNSLTVSVTIPLMPWDPIWKNSKMGVSKLQMYQTQSLEVERKIASSGELLIKLKELHDLAIKQAERTWLLEKDRLDLYKIRANNGDISELEVKYQEIQAKNTLLDWYVARIARISSLLTGD